VPEAKLKDLPRPQKSNGLKYAVFGAVLVVAGGVAIALFPGERHVVADNPRSSYAMITLANLPQNSMIYLDSVRMLMNPIEIPVGNAPHEVWVRAVGYHPRSFIVVPTENQAIDSSMVAVQ
jgi:hypothetical protein